MQINRKCGRACVNYHLSALKPLRSFGPTQRGPTIVLCYTERVYGDHAMAPLITDFEQRLNGIQTDLQRITNKSWTETEWNGLFRWNGPETGSFLGHIHIFFFFGGGGRGSWSSNYWCFYS